MLSRFHPIPGRYGRTDGENCYINIARQHTRVSVLTRDKKRIPAIITGRISSFFLLLYLLLLYTEFTLLA